MNIERRGGSLSFLFGAREVRVELVESEPWFVAKDVCECLGIGTEQIRRLDDDERGLCSTQTPSGLQEMATVNEPGLYSLVLGSRKPEAKAFKRWVTHDVLPAIRRTGGYGAQQLTRDALVGMVRELVPMIVELVKPQVTTVSVVQTPSLDRMHAGAITREKAALVQLGLRVQRWKTRAEGNKKLQRLIGDATGGYGDRAGAPLRLMPVQLVPVAQRALAALRIDLERQDALMFGNDATRQNVLPFMRNGLTRKPD
jgi:prophage antirepressor-like protein